MSRVMKLVQGEVTIKFDISLFVDMDMDNETIEESLKELAFNDVKSGETECEILTDVCVKVDEETCDKYEGQVISDNEWKEILDKDIEL